MLRVAHTHEAQRAGPMCGIRMHLEFTRMLGCTPQDTLPLSCSADERCEVCCSLKFRQSEPAGLSQVPGNQFSQQLVAVGCGVNGVGKHVVRHVARLQVGGVANQ